MTASGRRSSTAFTKARPQPVRPGWRAGVGRRPTSIRTRAISGCSGRTPTGGRCARPVTTAGRKRRKTGQCRVMGEVIPMRGAKPRAFRAGTVSASEGMKVARGWFSADARGAEWDRSSSYPHDQAPNIRTPTSRPSSTIAWRSASSRRPAASSRTRVPYQSKAGPEEEARSPDPSGGHKSVLAPLAAELGLTPSAVRVLPRVSRAIVGLDLFSRDF